MPTKFKRYGRNAIPKWTTGFDFNKLGELRAEVRSLNGRYSREWNLDHVVPLNSPLVCGLHWWQNLEISERAANTFKGNSWWPDMPDYSEADLEQLYRSAKRLRLGFFRWEFLRYAHRKQEPQNEISTHSTTRTYWNCSR